MAGLAVGGDPQRWLDIGHEIAMAAGRLETELADGHALGVAPLAGAWYGPAADSFVTYWQSRRGRYEDLAGLTRRLGNVIEAYGQRLWDMRARAMALERDWCSAGLWVTDTGEGFMLPPGAESLAPQAHLSLQNDLISAVHQVEGLASDVVGANEELVAALVTLIQMLDEFELAAGLTVAEGYLHHLTSDPLRLIHTGLSVAEQVTKGAAERVAARASALGHDLSAGTAAERSAAGRLLPAAGEDAARARMVSDVTEVGGSVVLVALAGETVWRVSGDAGRQGWGTSLEENAGDITSTGILVAAGVAAVLGAPEIVAGVGGAVLLGAVAWGVGATVQAVVDHRRAIGHFLEHVF